ncbi:MAG: nucleotidyltransferase domain-containing protein [Rhodocyclaceae bacterium]|nr:nucleotidyltransferase domain-containing protein [Rhodocyclaceae bacterium]
MRLTQEQIDEITRTVAALTHGAAEVYLFGSRLDDRARGGDIDLLIETTTPLTLIERARIKATLENRVGLPVDIVARGSTAPATPFQNLARARAVRLLGQSA